MIVKRDGHDITDALLNACAALAEDPEFEARLEQKNREIDAAIDQKLKRIKGCGLRPG